MVQTNEHIFKGTAVNDINSSKMEYFQARSKIYHNNNKKIKKYAILHKKLIQ
jgi:hypothetical protein